VVKIAAELVVRGCIGKGGVRKELVCLLDLIRIEQLLEY